MLQRMRTPLLYASMNNKEMDLILWLLLIYFPEDSAIWGKNLIQQLNLIVLELFNYTTFVQHFYMNYTCLKFTSYVY